MENEMIYDSLNDSILGIIKELQIKSKDEDFEERKTETLNIIKIFQEQKLNKAVNELKESQEWDKFTVAFYGETNAGKSTIIESLRIYFQEEDKLEQQTKFKSILKEYEQNIDKFEIEMDNNKKEISDLEQNTELLTSNFGIEKEELLSKINELIFEDEKKKQSSLIYKILSFVHVINVDKKVNEFKKILNNKEEIFEKEIRKIEIILNIKRNKVLEIDVKMKDFKNNSFNLLHTFRDGQIIGDGRSDFTQEAKIYNFSYNNQKFAFIDVPGIEGDEKKVIDEISLSVKKAHAIFYITSSPTAPQKGDENKKGTLEKIKEHLGSQTEVYTIFNKRINNPMQLNKLFANDEDNDEIKSLKDLDKKIFEVLGENYVGHKKISSKVVFLAIADCLPKETTQYNERIKFLEKYSSDELLEKSLFNNFCQFITNEMIINTKQKIKKSNYNKANSLLKELIDILLKVSKENFEPLYEGVREEVKIVSSNLNDSLRKIEIDLEIVVETALRDFESKTRKEIYSYIEQNVSDDSFENKLKKLLNDNLEKMKEIIPINIEIQMCKFQVSIEEVLENFKRRVDLVIVDYQTFNSDNLDSRFNINLNINNGINGWAVASGFLAAGGTAYTYWSIAAANSWNWVGWTMIAAGILTTLLSWGKGVWKFFSDDYKKSEQRDSADDNLKKIIQNIKPKIMENVKPISKETSIQINKIVDNLDNLVNQRKLANDYIKESYENLIIISHKITLEGNKQ